VGVGKEPLNEVVARFPVGVRGLIEPLVKCFAEPGDSAFVVVKSRILQKPVSLFI
jgi:hypothetical protein